MCKVKEFKVFSILAILQAANVSSLCVVTVLAPVVVTPCVQALNAREFPASHRSYAELQANLGDAAAGLNKATGDVVQSSRGNPAQLASSVRHFGTAFGSLLGCGMEMAGQTHDTEVGSSPLDTFDHNAPCDWISCSTPVEWHKLHYL